MIDKSDLKNLIRAHLAPPLKAAGFKKTGLVWNRRSGSLVHVIQMQLSQWNDADEVSFTIDVGVMVPLVMRIVWDKEPPTTVRESDCFPRFRIGYLPALGVGRDIWWELHGFEDIDRVGPEVAKEIESKCLPCLDECSSIQAALELAHHGIESHPVAERLAFAVLLTLSGQGKAGERLLDEMEADPDIEDWRTNIRQIRSRLRERELK